MRGVDGDRSVIWTWKDRDSAVWSIIVLTGAKESRLPSFSAVSWELDGNLVGAYVHVDREGNYIYMHVFSGS